MLPTYEIQVLKRFILAYKQNLVNGELVPEKLLSEFPTYEDAFCLGTGVKEIFAANIEAALAKYFQED